MVQDCIYLSNLDAASTSEHKPIISSRVKSDGDRAVKIVQYPVFDRGTHKPQLKLHYGDHKTTICPQPYKQADRNYYEMKASRHGVALIINNLDSMWFPELQRTQEYNLIQTFYFLGYRPIVCNNLTSDEVRNIIGNLDAFLTNSNDIAAAKVENDSFVCCIMYRGHMDYIFCSDSLISLLDVVMLTGKSKILRGKPKIFFNCRYEFGMPWPDESSSSMLRILCGVDICVCSTMEAISYVYNYQQFITQLCEILCEYGTCDTFSSLCGRLNLYERKDRKSHREQPCYIHSTLKNEVHFFFE